MSLDLDQRQRAMLREMHVPVWWPQSAPTAQHQAAPIDAQPSVAAQHRPVAAWPTASPQVVATPPSPLATATAPDRLPNDVASMDWPTLAGTISTCKACNLCVGRKAPVFASVAAPGQADWLVVGEPPDEQEERAGSPFAGQSGELLDNMLRAVHLTRAGVGKTGARVTNVVKCRPAAARNPQADELATCAVYLRREITLVQPRVILAMGRFAAQSLLGACHPELAGLPFGKLRGQAYRYEGVPVVVTHHPTRLLRAQDDKAGAWADLCLAQSVARQLA